ncbi:MAG: hypothetical protein AAFR20_11485, partial [Pseudomonadota bacterium]
PSLVIPVTSLRANQTLPSIAPQICEWVFNQPRLLALKYCENPFSLPACVGQATPSRMKPSFAPVPSRDDTIFPIGLANKILVEKQGDVSPNQRVQTRRTITMLTPRKSKSQINRIASGLTDGTQIVHLSVSE